MDQRGAPQAPRRVNLKSLDLGCAPYVLYGVKYIDPVSLKCHVNLKFLHAPLFFKNAEAKAGFEMC